MLWSHNAYNSFKEMLECNKTLKADGILPVREESRLIKHRHGGLIHWVCLHAHYEFNLHLSCFKAIIRVGETQSRHLIYCGMSTHLKHTDGTQDELRERRLTKREGNTSFFFKIPFFIYLWLRILIISRNDVCGSLRVIIELRVI